MSILTVKGLTKTFGGLTAVSGVNMTLEKGELVGLIGPNGAGKTTVFNMLTGVYKPTDGDIKLLGSSIVGKKPHEITEAGIARTFQNIRLFKSMTVLENIEIAFHTRMHYTLFDTLLRTKKYRNAERGARERALEILSVFGMTPIDFIDGPWWAKMMVLCIYTVWVVLPFKILILTSALASVKKDYYNAAKVDGTPRLRVFCRITLPMISPMLFYLIITGFIGAFKAYSDAVALFGTQLNAAEMNTIVGYVYDMLYGDSGGYPSYASAAAIILFVIVLTITVINLLVSRRHVHYS